MGAADELVLEENEPSQCRLSALAQIEDAPAIDGEAKEEPQPTEGKALSNHEEDHDGPKGKRALEEALQSE